MQHPPSYTGGPRPWIPCATPSNVPHQCQSATKCCIIPTWATWGTLHHVLSEAYHLTGRSAPCHHTEWQQYSGYWKYFISSKEYLQVIEKLLVTMETKTDCVVFPQSMTAKINVGKWRNEICSPSPSPKQRWLTAYSSKGCIPEKTLRNLLVKVKVFFLCG